MSSLKKLRYFLEDVEDFFDEHLKGNAPKIPSEWKKKIVDYLPGAVILIFIAVLGSVLSYLKITTLLASIGYLYVITEGIRGIIGVILLISTLVLLGFALPSLARHKEAGWKFFLYALLVMAVHDLINLNVGNLVFHDFLLLYILFQIREYYR